MIDESLLRDYQATRPPEVDRSVLCHAPFTSMNFDQYGRARVCCYNWRAVLGTWPETSIAAMWSGAQATALRRSFLERTESTGCDLCFDQLRARNFEGTLMRGFDWLGLSGGYRPELEPHAPRIMEFELSNTCNLECVQCQAKWSSLIRRNRDHLPPLPMPYDETFVDQLEPYLPSLVAARFLGGEPMLIRLYHLIWERIRTVNPSILVSITTNGTVIPERAFAALADLRSNICLSIDSLDPVNYARIREHGSLDVVLANFERWHRYASERGTAVSISVCPMSYNWRDLPEFLRFSERHGAPLYFNTVVRPWAASLAGLPHEELDDVVALFTQHQPAAGTVNASAWAGVIHQVASWRDTRRELDGRFSGLIPSVRGAARSQASALNRKDGDSCELVADAVARLVASSWLDRVPSASPSQAELVRDYGDSHPALTSAAVERLRAADLDLAGRLRQMTPVTATEGEQPVDQRLLLRVLFLLRNIGLLVESGPAVPVPAREGVALDVEAIEGMPVSLQPRIDWREMWWMFESSSWHVLAEWLDQLPGLANRPSSPSTPDQSPPA
jgi:hypothetical protein